MTRPPKLGCCFLLVGLASHGWLGFGQDPGRVSTLPSRLGKWTFHVDGRPVPLFWAYGLEDERDLRDYQAFGFNTVYVDLPWPQDATINDLRALFAQRMAVVQAAQRLGLWCLIGLEVAPLATRLSDDDPVIRIAPGVERYTRALDQWLDLVVKNFGPFPNVIGYGTQHDPRERMTLDDLGFREFLKPLWDQPGRLGAHWGTRLSDWREVTLALPAALDRQAGVPVSHATLDRALYEWTTTSRLHGYWAAALKQRDPLRLVVTGRQRDYKSLACLPRGFDGVVVFAAPGEVEIDLNSHNPHAVDLARRGGVHCAVPCFLTAPNATVREELLERQGLWLKEAFLHGASGACFREWTDLRGNARARARIRQAIEEVVASGLVEQAPTPTSAILHEPFADSAVIEQGQRREPLYGFLPNFAPDTPMLLHFSQRRGHRYGQVEVIGPESLLPATLARYGAVLAPSALYLDLRAQEALAAYVANGGTLVADLGAGAAQTSGHMDMLPDLLAELFGVVGVSRWLGSAHNLIFPQAHPLFPSVEEWTQSSGNLPEQLTVGGRLGVTRLTPEAIPFGIAVVEPKSAVKRRQRRPLPTEFSAVSLRPLGKGHALYAPFRLWANWPSNGDAYQEFHHDLFARNAVIELTDFELLYGDGPQAHVRSDELAVSAAAFAGGYAFFNGSDRPKLTAANVVGFGGALLTNADVAYSPPTLPVRSPPPHRLAGLPSLFGPDEPAQLASLRLLLNPGDLTFCRFVPVRVIAHEASFTAQLEEYHPTRIRFKAWVPTPIVSVTGKSRPNRPTSGTVRFVVTTGDYVIAPQSKHVLTIAHLEANRAEAVRTERGTAEPDQNGAIIVERKGVGFRLTLEPLRK